MLRKRAAAEERAAKQAIDNAIHALFSDQLGRGKAYRDATVANFVDATPEQRRVKLQCVEYGKRLIENVAARRNLIWLGPVGTGKDHLMAALMKRAIYEGLKVVWRNGSSMFAEMKEAIDKGDESKLALRLSAPHVLAISDPVPPVTDGRVDPVSRYIGERMFDVIDRRYSAGRPTWITVNASSRADVEKLLPLSVVDRLWHDAVVMHCNWPSYRKD